MLTKSSSSRLLFEMDKIISNVTQAVIDNIMKEGILVDNFPEDYALLGSSSEGCMLARMFYSDGHENVNREFEVDMLK